jgi:hypothetical protein
MTNKQIDPEDYIVDTSYLAKCLGISERHINRLAAEGHLPRHRDERGVPIDGRWNLKHCINDFLVYKKAPMEPSGYRRPCYVAT